jgi:signal transduction histidine kinase/sensor domain CHASE-containing protein
MSLSRKIALVSAAGAVVVVALTASLILLFMRSLQQSEEQNMSMVVEQAISTFDGQLQSLDVLNRDWATWDDTYNFVQFPGGNEDYLEVNFTDAIFADARLNFILIIDNSGRLVHGEAFDLNTAGEMPIPESLQDHIFDEALVCHEGVDDGALGIILLPEGPLLVSSRPILTSEGEGPIEGTIIMGQFVDSSVADALSRTIPLPLVMMTVNDMNMPSDLELARSSLTIEAPVLIRAINSESMAGYFLLQDIYGNPAIIFRLTMPRTLYTQSVTTMRYFLLAIMGFALLCAGIFTQSVRRGVVSRVARVAEFMSSIGTTRDLSKRLTIQGNDEITKLTKDINTTIEALEEAQSNTKAQKRLIDRILATTPSAVLVIGDDDRIKLANRAFYSAFEKKDTELETKPISEIVPTKELWPALSEARSGKTLSVRHEFRHRVNGHERMFVANILRMGEDEVLFVLDDVTEERAKQERLHLTDRLASIGEMAAGIAHELNNPLTGVIGLAQLLLDEEMSDGANEDLKLIYNEAQRAAAVVKKLLTFGRQHPIERKAVQINTIVEDVVSLRAYEQKVNNIRVTTQFDDHLPEIVADRFEMQQVFLNIVLNAEQAMIETHKEGTLTIATERVDGKIKVSFSDDGPGISPDSMRKLFSPFFTTKVLGKGTGLGLSICYGIVTSHGGRIYAQSELGKGATFVIELPVGGHQEGGLYDARQRTS